MINGQRKSKFKYPVMLIFDCCFFQNNRIFHVETNFHLLVLLHFSQASRKKIRKKLLAEQRGSSESEDEALG